jgi:hypothetical protein
MFFSEETLHYIEEGWQNRKKDNIMNYMILKNMIITGIKTNFFFSSISIFRQLLLRQL